MAATPYLVSLPSPDAMPARTLVNGVSAMAINAESVADARAMAKAQAGQDVNANWSLADVAAIVAATDMNGWKLRVRVVSPLGVERFDGTVQNTGAVVGITPATGVLTFTGNGVNDQTITIGTHVYTWKTTLTGAANEVHIKGTAALSIVALVAAINDTGVEGTDYGTGTVANAFVTAADGAGDTVDLTAIVYGTAGNSIATTETGTNTSFGGATLSGGADATDKMSTLASQMRTALNLDDNVAASIFVSSTNVLTVAGTADVLGDHRVFAYVSPPNAEETEEGVPGFITSITHNGAAGAALSIDFVADSYVVPKVAALLGAAV
jgi:hypothetical protein